MIRFNAVIAAQEMWEIYGQEAERVAVENADAHKKRGEIMTAREWQRTAHAVRLYIGRTPHPKRPYGARRPFKALPMSGIAKLEAEIRDLLNQAS